MLLGRGVKEGKDEEQKTYLKQLRDIFGDIPHAPNIETL